MLEAPYNVTRGSAKLQRKAIDSKQRQVTRPTAVKRDARDLAVLRMRGAPQLDDWKHDSSCQRPHALKLAECPLSEVPLYCVSQTGSNLLSVLQVREVSVFRGFLYRH